MCEHVILVVHDVGVANQVDMPVEKRCVGGIVVFYREIVAVGVAAANRAIDHIVDTPRAMIDEGDD